MTCQAPLTPEAALACFPGGEGLPLRPVPEGLINRTWAVGDPPRFALQQVSRVIPAEAHPRVDLVTRHLAAQRLETPLLVRDRRGEAAVRGPEGSWWRLLTWVPGVTHHRVPHPAHAASAGALVGRFHLALQSLGDPLVPLRLQVHDTSAHMRRLELTVASCGSHRLAHGIRATASSILDAWARYCSAYGDLALPERPAHGDLKISNVRFDAADERAVCLIDLDTLGRLPLDAEIGDALRSWCNPAGEDTAAGRVDVEVFTAAVAGYLGSATFVTASERAGLVPGLQRIAAELAARFCTDAYEESYFGWDPRVAPGHGEHNLLRARAQLALALDVERRRAELERVVDGCFRG